MKKWLKYLLVSIIALAFYDSAGEFFDSPSLHGEYTSSICSTTISNPETDICAPRQESSVTAPRPASNVSSSRIQSNGRRYESNHRQNFEFVKSGKTINSGIRYVLQKQSIFNHSSLIEPASRLVCLCRFII